MKEFNHNNNKIKIEDVTNDISSAIQNSIKRDKGHGKKTKKKQKKIKKYNKILSVEREEEEKIEERVEFIEQFSMDTLISSVSNMKVDNQIISEIRPWLYLVIRRLCYQLLLANVTVY